MERTEYLQRPPIKGITFEIGNDMVKIQSPSTLFIHVVKPEKISLSEVERHFRKLKKAAKNSGNVKLKGVTKFLPAVRALYPAYCEGFDKITGNFSDIAELARRLRTDGIHIGCRDDALLDMATDRQHEITSINYRNTDYSRFLEYYNDLKRAVRAAHEAIDNGTEVTVHIT